MWIEKIYSLHHLPVSC